MAITEKMKGRTVLITGANRGVGKETALQLAQCGAKIIMACRNIEAGKTAAQEISTATGNIEIVVKELDLSKLSSVRAFAEDILANEPKLDVLINNAGVILDHEKQVTSENLELTFVTNYLGHFLLTNLLLPLLKKSAPSRIVVLSSLLYLYGHADFENLNSELKYDNMDAYNGSKLCGILFMRELSRKLEGTGVTVNALHPGIIMTEILHNIPRYWTLFYKLLFPLWTTAEKAGGFAAELASCDEISRVTGRFRLMGKWSSIAPHGDNKLVARKLWEVSNKLCGLESA